MQLFFGVKVFIIPQLKRVVAGLFWALKSSFSLFFDDMSHVLRTNLHGAAIL